MSIHDHPRFADALALLDAGDAEGLGALLAEDPTLVHARAASIEEPYEGYFYGATLLHHVAGNPIRGSLPDNIVEMTTLLLTRGADPEAGCGGGPEQPATDGGTVMGLVTSGALAHELGHTEGLIDVLLDHGARLDPEGGMFGTLYHTVEHQGQRDVARMLHARGVRADFPIAAGLGRVDLMESFLGTDGALTDGAAEIWTRTVRGGSALSSEEIWADALLAASANGWTEAVGWLLERGAPIDAVRKWGPFPVTALHCAGWAGWPDVVSLLLERGADPAVREPTYDGTPLVWAAHAKREAAVKAFVDAGVTE
ncbi:MAG: ankyrin repeat domain-containing protein [Gemmatimonadota bacterium]